MKTGSKCSSLLLQPSRVWTSILAAGASAGVIPAGLGARDTLRLEAAMRLYGNDMDETTTVVEADLGWIVGWKKQEFLGFDVLQRQKAEGAARKLVGFEMLDRAIARHGYDVYFDGAHAGTVTSGTQTPFLKKAIGMAYVPSDRTAPGTEFDVDVRGRRVRAAVVPMPFYKRQNSAELQFPRQRRVEGATMYPADLKYTKDHEWVRIAGAEARVGITDYAQKQLGDVVFSSSRKSGARSRRAKSSGRSSR